MFKVSLILQLVEKERAGLKTRSKCSKWFTSSVSTSIKTVIPDFSQLLFVPLQILLSFSASSWFANVYETVSIGNQEPQQNENFKDDFYATTQFHDAFWTSEDTALTSSNLLDLFRLVMNMPDGCWLLSIQCLRGG
jgi:hypothetical protein